MHIGDADSPAAGTTAGSDSTANVAATFERRLAAQWPYVEWWDSHVVMAVSGGADSVALLRGIAALKAAYGGTGKLWVAHLDHGLRGAEAKADADWLKELSERFALASEFAHVDVSACAAEQGDGWEAAARVARYDFLRQTAERVGARFVATAHTANDQVETVLQRIIRGTGLSGLAGIPSRRALSKCTVLVRPMLEIHRGEVLEYLAAIGQDYRTDPSNADMRFTRNRLRHELLPILRSGFNKDVDAALLRLAQQSDEATQVLQSLATEIFDKSVTLKLNQKAAGNDGEKQTANSVHVNCVSLSSQPAILIREVSKLAWLAAGWPLQSMGFREWQLLAEIVRNAAETHANLPGNVLARRDGHLLVLERRGLS
jgi:tRNA(Ile)-lysidine synthase